MFAASTYEEIVRREMDVENLEIVVFLFVRPTNHQAMDIIKEFEYIHYNSARYCSIYAVGYSNDFSKAEDHTYKRIETIVNSEWYFSFKDFVEFKNKLEDRIKWEYSGETEVLILQNNPGRRDPLNFKNYVAIDVNKGLREGYMDSFQLFMESLIRSSKSNVTAKECISDVSKNAISIKDIIADAIKSSKKISAPVKKILADRLFYRPANTMKK